MLETETDETLFLLWMRLLRRARSLTNSSELQETNLEKEDGWGQGGAIS